jgi:hypothetical protein
MADVLIRDIPEAVRRLSRRTDTLPRHTATIRRRTRGAGSRLRT